MTLPNARLGAVRIAVRMLRGATARYGVIVPSVLVAALSTHALPRVLGGQSVSSGAPAMRASVVVSPAFQSWKFGKPIPLDSILVTGVTQLSVPFAVQVPFASRWTASATGAFASSTLSAENGTGSVSRSFAGPTDLRLRASGPLRGDGLRLTLGVNVPTGAVDLTPLQNDVIRVTAAPALDARVPIAGIGFGATAGLVFARQIGPWAWAFGAGAEKRGRYSPLDAQIAGVDARTELDPGGAAHFSLGGDGFIGPNRVLLGVVVDVYGEDELRQTVGTNAPRTQSYQLGPTVSASAAIEIKNERFRDLMVRVNERHRAGFRDGSGQSVAGSRGNYFDVGVSGTLGAPNARALLLGVNARQHSGLPVDKGLIGAALTAIGATVGVAVPADQFALSATAELSAGRLKTQLVTTTMTSLTLGLSVSRR
ncbi:MAG: hypothetical protein IT353_08735 [Gemmatimonadaceae bacterium]|nr:hypothetical protein [Gemmatimonadaceae bacterium]